MRIRLCLSITVGFLLINASGDSEKRKLMNMLTINQIEIKSKDILNKLKIFMEYDDIQALMEVNEELKKFEDFEKPDKQEWILVRQSQAELWIQMIQAINVKYDNHFDPKDAPEINVAPPGPYPSGISSDSIKEPDLREQYEQAIIANESKRTQYEFQYKLNSLRSEIYSNAQRVLTALYKRSPENMDELTKLLQSHGVNELFEIEGWK